MTNTLANAAVRLHPTEANQRRRILDRKRPPSPYERREVRELYFSDHLAVWAISRMTRLSRKAVADIVRSALPVG